MLCNLIFFAPVFFSSCNEDKSGGIAINWENDRPVSISIAKRLMNGLKADPLAQQIKIRLTEGNDTTAILGSYKSVGQAIVFEPLIPFSRGLHYEVFYNANSIGKIEIPSANVSESSVLEKLYPSQDTLPANLLKFYLQFSKPMREGVSDQYISIIKNEKDTLPGIFLKLEPELWNEDRTILTIWLDPGRIKRDLIPNLLMGNPLANGATYKLLISKNWPNAKGLLLHDDFVKSFKVSERDSLPPGINQWTIHPPKANSVEPLQINLNESLDYFLLLEAIKIVDQNDVVVPVKIEIGENERELRFTPKAEWARGDYKLKVEARLEDLAGNNLNRPFDRDLTQKNKLNPASIQYRLFKIK